MQHSWQIIDSGALTRTWLVTFGDLLTLLLCFFLCIVSFSSLNKNARPAQGIEKGGDSSAKPTRVTAQAPEDIRGTPLAKVVESGHREAVEPLALRDVDFQAAGEGMTVEAEARIREYLANMHESQSRLLVETCDGSSNTAEWFVAVNRALALKGQLLDASFPPDRLEIRVLGRDCGLLATAGQSGVVARVVPRLERERNG